MPRDIGDVSTIGEVTADYLVRIVDNPNSEYPTEKLIPGAELTPAAGGVSVADAGGYYTGTNVETALQEVGMYAAAMEMLQPQNQLPVLWLDAAHSVAGEQAAVNRGTGGSALNASYGSTTGADTNDPLLLTHDGENYAYLSGVAGNYLSTPDAASLDITGDIELVVRASLDDWTSGIQALIGKWEGSGAYLLRLQSDGSLGYFDGGVYGGGMFSAVGPWVDGASYWVKVTHNTTTGVVAFFYAADQPAEPSSWSTLANISGGATPGARAATTDIVQIGRYSSANYATGKFHRAIIRDGIGGTTVLDVNCATDITSSAATSFAATTGQTVTVARSASGRKTALVTRPVWLFGTDDYMEIADNALLDFDADDSFTIVAVFRAFDTITSGVGILGKYSVGAPGYDLIFGTSNRLRATLRDGTLNSDTAASGPVLTPGQLSTVAMTRNVVADQWGVGVNASEFTMTDVTTGTAANSQPFTIGRREGFNYLNGEIVAVAVFRRALTATEIANICAYYGTV